MLNITGMKKCLPWVVSVNLLSCAIKINPVLNQWLVRADELVVEDGVTEYLLWRHDIKRILETAVNVEIQRIDSGRDMVGEGVLWDSKRKCLYWVDAIRSLIRRYVPATGKVTDWKMPMHVGSLALHEEDNKLIAALRDGFYEVSLITGEATVIARRDDIPEGARLNDGKTDRQGRFLSGAILSNPWVREEGKKCGGKLYRLNLDRSVEVLEDDIRLANGTCFSPSGDRLYFTDSPDLEIRVYDYDGATGAISNRRHFADLKALGSLADGATVDAGGCLWVTLPQIASIVQFSPEGTVLRTIKTPCKMPVCVSFGGDNLDELYISSLSDSGNGRLVSNDPACGGLYKITGLGVKGLPEAVFAG